MRTSASNRVTGNLSFSSKHNYYVSINNEGLAENCQYNIHAQYE